MQSVIQQNIWFLGELKVNSRLSMLGLKNTLDTSNYFKMFSLGLIIFMGIRRDYVCVGVHPPSCVRVCVFDQYDPQLLSVAPFMNILYDLRETE